MPFDVEAVRTQSPTHKLFYFDSVGSTMTEAAQLAASNEPHGTIVLAGEQTAGIGRFGRKWISEPELGIYCSVLLRLNLPLAMLPIASLLVALAVAEAIEKITGLACDLRWPNDVLIGERKVCGILTQLVDGCVIAGIGLNVNHTSFPPGLRTPATSLSLETRGQKFTREALVVASLASLDSFCRILEAKGTSEILRAFAMRSSYVTGRRVAVEDSNLRGVTTGMDDSGFLQLRTDEGDLHRLSAGGIRPVNE